ncbi:MAG TPA: hypothetical protein VK590_16250, partial [Saprospiraceae bacterium]|nr:hypothetical protein [Saprospiraceae bacterium]
AKVHPKFATPFLAIITYTAFDFTFAVFGGFQQLAVISSATLLTIYLGVVLASIKLRLKGLAENNQGFNLPGGLTIHIFALITICWFLSQLAMNEIIGILLFIALLSGIYLIIPFLKKMKFNSIR